MSQKMFLGTKTCFFGTPHNNKISLVCQFCCNLWIYSEALTVGIFSSIFVSSSLRNPFFCFFFFYSIDYEDLSQLHVWSRTTLSSSLNLRQTRLLAHVYSRENILAFMCSIAILIRELCEFNFALEKWYIFYKVRH